MKVNAYSQSTTPYQKIDQAEQSEQSGQIQGLPVSGPSTRQDEISISPEASAGVKPAQGLGPLKSGLADNYASSSVNTDNKFKQDLKKFAERLPTGSRESFQKLDLDKKKGIMELGQSFAGSNIENSSLLRLMESGRLFEKDDSGATPLERLNEISGAGPSKGSGGRSKGDSNFVMRVLNAVENPGQSREAKKRGVEKASNSPSEFIRKAGEEREDAQIVNTPSEWNDSPLEG